MNPIKLTAKSIFISPKVDKYCKEYRVLYRFLLFKLEDHFKGKSGSISFQDQEINRLNIRREKGRVVNEFLLPWPWSFIAKKIWIITQIEVQKTIVLFPEEYPDWYSHNLFLNPLTISH